MKKLSILGSTGSIGTQTLDIVKRSESKFAVSALAAGTNCKLMEEQARQFLPKIAVMANEEAAKSLRLSLKDTSVRVLAGEEGLCEAATIEEADMAVGAIVGIAGLMPVLQAIKAGKDIALANKETLVTAGNIVMRAAKKAKVKILPVDSEHSAIFQCMQGNLPPKRILLTASGGPFFNKTAEELNNVTREDALRHPNWVMGAKVTIDSASLMNKGLEVIEASHLFSMDADHIDVCIHRQSIIHSMIEFDDGSILAQMGSADMRTPISVALNHPERSKISGKPLNIFDVGALTFDKPDTKTFKSLSLAYRALRVGGTLPAVMNGANEEAVAGFLDGRCSFLDMADMVESAMDSHKVVGEPTLEDILNADREAREFVRRLR